MKQILIAVCVLIAGTSMAQTPKAISLKKGQEITVSSAAESNTDIGMGMTMTNNTTVQNKLVVIGEDASNFIVTNTTTKMKMDMEAMGQSQHFDSEKPEDKDSEIGKSVGPQINSVDTFLVDKKTGLATATNKTEDEKGGNKASIMGQGSSSKQSTEDAFIIIPANKKTGDSWETSASIKGITTKKVYTLKSIDKNTATITAKETVDGTTEQEIQGMSANVTTNSKSDVEIVADINTGLVSKRTIVADVNATIDFNGQSNPISSKSTTTVTYK
jgi:hypothetical protein